MNEYINLTLNNIENEHLCCAIGDKKHQLGVKSKKEWLKTRIPEGHIFRKLNTQGKVFIEYAPLETAWVPIDGEEYMYIYCLWVAGSFKGKGYGKELLEYAIQDSKAKHKKGICVLTSTKKKPFLSDKKFFMHYGFQVVDTIGEYELLALVFDKTFPKFRENARMMQIKGKALTIYYSPECPYISNCIKEIEEYQQENKVPIHLIKVDSCSIAKNVPCVFNNWATFKDGKFISNTLLNKNMLMKLLQEG